MISMCGIDKVDHSWSPQYLAQCLRYNWQLLSKLIYGYIPSEPNFLPCPKYSVPFRTLCPYTHCLEHPFPPTHPTPPHSTLYLVNSHLFFRTKMTGDLLLSTFLDSLRDHSSELTPNFAHYPYSHAHKIALQYVMFAYMSISSSRQWAPEEQ